MTLKSETQLVKDLAGLSCDPYRFALYAFPWGKAGTDLAEAHGPRRWQENILKNIGKRLQEGYRNEKALMPVLQAVASGHGVGKSALVAMLVAWALCTCADTRIVITANTEPQLRTKTFPEIAKWFRMLICAHWFKVHGLSIQSTQPGHDKTWRADAVTWSETNLDAFAGLHNAGRRIMLLFDEASGIPARVWEVAEGALTDENTEILWCVFGNPTQPSGRFFECFHRHEHRWHAKQIDSRTVEGTNKTLFATWAETYGEESDFMRVRVRGLFPQTASRQFISPALIEAACQREASAILSDPLIIGVDVARFGDDQSVLFFRKGRDARLISPIRLRGVDTMQLAARVVDEATRYRADAVFIDGGGVGGGVVDRCRQLNLRGLFEIHFGAKSDRAFGDATRYANKRAEIWGALRSWLEYGALPDDQELRTDLEAPFYYYNLRNEIALERKEEMKRRGLASPDLADALALTFSYPVQPSLQAGGPYLARLTHQRAAREEETYDMWQP